MKQINKKWTQVELDTLKKNYALGPTELMKLLPGRSYTGIVAKAHKLGLTDNRDWTNDEVKILKENYYDLGPYKLQGLLPNRTYMAIVAKGKSLGLINKDNIMWTNEEIEILKQYYPSEGTKVEKRLNNRSKTSILVAAQRYGINFDRTHEEWNISEDELVYEFYIRNGEESFNMLKDLLNILVKNNFKSHGLTTLRMKLLNFKYLEKGIGLSHPSLQSRAVFEKKNKSNKVSFN